MKKKPLKIVFGATSGETFSGASKALIELAENLKNKGIKVTVLLPENGDFKTELDRINISNFTFKEYSSWYTWKTEKSLNLPKYFIKRILNQLTILKISKFLKREKPDVVHVNALTAYTVGLAAIKLHIPVVWHMREFMEEDLGVKFTKESYSLKVLNQASAYVAISKAVKEKWQPVISKNIDVVYDGLPIENYLIKEKTNSSKHINVILYGRIVKEKGQLFFLKSMKNILKLYPQVNISLAGFVEDKNYFAKCKEFIDKNNLKDRVEYLGEVRNIKKMLSKQDIVCVCSTKEGFGRVIIESMLAGCIVVAANSGAASELIENSKNGYLYDSNSISDFQKKMEKAILMKDDLDLKKIQNYAKEFSTDNNAKNVLKIYERII